MRNELPLLMYLARFAQLMIGNNPWFISFLDYDSLAGYRTDTEYY